MRKHLILLLLLPMFSFGQVGLHDWDNSFYEKYKPSKFKNLEIAHQVIDTNNIDYELFNAAVFYCTNIQRTKYGKNPFKYSELLEKAAQDHSKNMVNHNFFSHTSTVRGKTSMTDRLNSVGIKKGYQAENISYNYESNPTYWTFALKLVDQWMNSEGHKKNILNSNYNYLGCGTYYYKNVEWKEYFWVKSTQTFSSTNK